MSTLETTTSNSELGRRALLRLLQDMSDRTLTSHDNHHHNNNSTGIGPTGEIPPISGGGTGGNRQAYEFFAFLLWYLLLVLCCLIPTCCAYRRRRRLEARLSQQQENFDQMQQQNLIFLNNLTQRQNTNEALFHEQRYQLVSKAVEDTTMMVQEKDIEQRRGVAGGGDGVRPRPAAVVPDVVNTSGRSLVVGAAGIVLDEETTALLRLPNDAPNGNRTVPAACAICLNAYEIRDRVTWSPMPTCQHAFHQECIIPWLTNKSECPCCRQEFCALPMSVRATSSGSGNRLTWSRFQPMAGAVVVVNAANEVPTTVTAAVGVSLTDEHDLSLVEERMEEGLSPPLHTIVTETTTESSTSPSSPGQPQLQSSPASPSSAVLECVDTALHDVESRPCHDDVGVTTELTPSSALLVAAAGTTIESTPQPVCMSSPDTEPITSARIHSPNDGVAVEEASLPSTPSHSS